MNRIYLDHWSINKNELSISLWKFYVKIKILHNDQTVYYQMYIKAHDNEELVFNFYTIEDAISFTEQIVNKCNDSSEVVKNYELMFNNGEFEKTSSKKKIKNKRCNNE